MLSGVATTPLAHQCSFPHIHRLKHNGIWGWGIHGLTFMTEMGGTYGSNGWGNYDLNGWGSYGKELLFMGDMLQGPEYPFRSSHDHRFRLL